MIYEQNRLTSFIKTILKKQSEYKIYYKLDSMINKIYASYLQIFLKINI